MAQRYRRTLEQSLHGLSEVAKEKEAIGNLDGLRGAVAYTPQDHGQDLQGQGSRTRPSVDMDEKQK